MRLHNISQVIYHADTCGWPSIDICSNLQKSCTSATLNDSLHSSLVPFLQGLFPAAAMSEILCFT